MNLCLGWSERIYCAAGIVKRITPERIIILRRLIWILLGDPRPSRVIIWVIPQIQDLGRPKGDLRIPFIRRFRANAPIESITVFEFWLINWLVGFYYKV